MSWFSYDPEDGFELHATEDEARKMAINAIDAYKDCDGWAEEVAGICYGFVTHQSTQVKLRPLAELNDDDREHAEANGWAYMCEYELLSIVREPT